MSGATPTAGKDGSVPAGVVADAATGNVVEMMEMGRKRKRGKNRRARRTWIPGQSEILRESGIFVHLDAKLASALTNILEGDLARQVDIFKEQEAKEKRYARGRQILLMVHKCFSTNIKHGAIYHFKALLQ